MLNSEMLQAYQKRWQAVAEFENVERQQVSLAERWRRMNNLLQIALAIGLQPVDSYREYEVIHQRWTLLRARYLDKSSKESS